MRRCLLPLLLLFCNPVWAQSNQGTEHWVAFMENLDLMFNGPPSFHLVISSEGGAAGTVSIPATGFAIPFTVAAGTDQVIDLPANTYYAEGDEALFNFGIRVASDAPVNVYAYHDRAYFSEATLVLPTTILGTDHVVLARTDDNGNAPSELVVLATASATEVEITPSALTLGFRPPGVPFTVTLNAGQSLQLQAMGDLSGTRVRSLDPTKPLAVFAGALRAQVDCDLGGADDHLYNQVYPLQHWGRDHFVVPFKDRGGDEVRVVAGTEPATVSVGSAQYPLAPGQVVVLSVATPTRILSNVPVAVGQFNNSQACNNGQPGDPCYLFLPATPLRHERSLWNARDAAGTPSHFVNVVVQAGGGVGGVLLDGVDVSGQFLPVPGQAGWWYAQLGIAGGSHELLSDKPYQAVAYSMGEYNSYAHALGFDLDLVNALPDMHSAPRPTATLLPPGGQWTPGWAQQGTEQVRLLDPRGRLLRVLALQPGGTLVLGVPEPGLYLAERWANGQRLAVYRVVVQ
jgi:hypothetical protein